MFQIVHRYLNIDLRNDGVLLTNFPIATFAFCTELAFIFSLSTEISWTFHCNLSPSTLALTLAKHKHPTSVIKTLLLMSQNPRYYAKKKHTKRFSSHRNDASVEKGSLISFPMIYRNRVGSLVRDPLPIPKYFHCVAII